MLYKKSVLYIAQFVLLLATGLFLVYYSLANISYHSLVDQLSNGNYWLCLPIYLVSVSGYFFRIKRWQLLYESMNCKVPAKMLFISLCTGYLVNLAVPRLGEISRCVMIKKSTGVAFSKSLFTIFFERLFDTFCLAFLLLIAGIAFIRHSGKFMYSHIWMPLSNKMSSPALLWIGITTLSVTVALILLYRILRQKSYIKNNLTLLHKWMKQILKMEHRMQFWGYTFLIWLCYFLMTYIWLYLFEESAKLTWANAFFVMAVGSIGRSIPIQGGGMGAYHFLVSHAFALFGLSLVTGNALAIVIHGAQMIFTLITGAACYIWFLVLLKKPNFAV